MIDLGLPSGTKWACCNVGASKPEDYGGYYAWGETEEKSYYFWSTYMHCDGTWNTCHNISNEISGTSYDVAHVKWGNSWCMPTKVQQAELRRFCKWVWTSRNGVNGYLFTGPNGGQIFLPAAGHRWRGQFINVGSSGKFWSGTPYDDGDDTHAYNLQFDSRFVIENDLWYRYHGQPVRPVAR